MLKKIIQELSPYPVLWAYRRANCLHASIGFQRSDGRLISNSFAISREALANARSRKVKAALMRYHVKRAVAEMDRFLADNPGKARA